MKTKRSANILLGMVLMHALWISLWLCLSSKVIPAPWGVYQHLIQMSDGSMYRHLGVSLWRVILGIAISLGLALPVALILVRSHRAGEMVEAFIYLSYPIPKLALLPIVMLLGGLGESTKVTMIVLIILFQLVISLRDSLKQVPRDSLNLMVALGASKTQYLRHVYLPAILPDVLTALRIALGTAISVLFVTETYGTSYGMGYYIVDAWMRLDYLDMYSGIILLGSTGFILFVLIDLFEYLLCPWQR